MTVGNYLDLFSTQLKDENRLGYAECFKGLKSSLLLYCKSLDIKFSAIDHQWLKGYELHLKKGGKAKNTIGIRFRSLRALYNKAIADDGQI